MNRLKLIIILLLIIPLMGYSQSEKTELVKDDKGSTNLYMDLGVIGSSFQDVKYSKVQYGGLGLNIDLGYNKTKSKYYYEALISLAYAKESAATHTNGKATIYYPNVRFKYLRKINSNLFIGGRIDLLDFYLRSIDGLENNSSYYINGHNLYGSLICNKKINSNWNIQSSFDLGLLSFMKESTSFAFSAPQNGLETGEFNYQNGKLSAFFGYKYFEMKYLGNYLNTQISFLLKYKKRFSFGYEWSILHFANVKSYPVTMGMHNIIVRYNIIHK